ncbi:MAG: hypothetical protein OEW36_10270 [Hylemonella sp.]|nr:hypothetical protein [Hylemonella sp.]
MTKAIVVFFSACLLSLTAVADDAAKAAAEAKAKKEYAAKMGAYANCKAQDKAAANHRRSVKNAKPATATPACVKPGKM